MKNAGGDMAQPFRIHHGVSSHIGFGRPQEIHHGER